MAESDSLPESETTVTLLLLGDAGCGKTTFLSWVDIPYSFSLSALNANITRSRLKHGRRATPAHPGPSGDCNNETLRDTDQPFIYDIRFSKKKFTLEMYDTSNPNQHWTTLRPDVVVLAFDISNRETLAGLKAVLFSSPFSPGSGCWRLTPWLSGDTMSFGTSSMVMASAYLS